MVGPSYALRLARLAAAALFGILLSAMAVMPGDAAPAPGGLQHFFDCFGLLIHDGMAHAHYCAPSSYVPSNDSLGTIMHGVNSDSACPGIGSIGAPLFATFKIASLDRDFGGTGALLPPAMRQLAITCNTCVSCDNSADRGVPLFEPFRVASLSDQLEAPSARTAVHVLLLACCPGPPI